MPPHDLGNWSSEKYVISEPVLDELAPENPSRSNGDEDEHESRDREYGCGVADRSRGFAFRVARSIRPKPRFALFIATACGLGYIQSCRVLLVHWQVFYCSQFLMLYFWGEIPYMLANVSVGDFFVKVPVGYFNLFVWAYLILLVLVSAVGVWAAELAARFWRRAIPVASSWTKCRVSSLLCW